MSSARPTPITRRRILRLGAIATAGAGLGAVNLAQPAAAERDAERLPVSGHRGGRIDVHHHVLTPKMKKWAIDHGLLPPQGGPRWGEWSLSETLEVMDANEIAAGVASQPAPSMAFRDRERALSGPKLFNEENAELVKDHPKRFGFFAYVPLLHVDIAVREAVYALDELDADGVILMTNDGSRYLGHKRFDPLFAELDRRGAVVFTHPGALPGTEFEVPGMEDWIADFMLDTTRAAFNLINSGTMDRYHRIKVILAHAGGFLPYIGGRIEHAGRTGRGPSPAAFRRALRRFYYDTAAPPSPYATPTLLAAAGHQQLLYGTDWAQNTASEVTAYTRAIEHDPSLDDRMRANINRSNALRLLPHLARRLTD